jgi:MoxR-like ATPase
LAANAPKRGTVTPALVQKFQDIFGKDGFLRAYNIERDEQIDSVGLSLIAGLDPLYLGPPGTGKTWMLEGTMRCIDTNGQDNALFSTLVFKETPADDVLGPRSLVAMKADKIERLMDGYLPTAIVAYVDEFFKASPTLANSLLDIMANRVLKVGSTVHDASQLLCMFASSNELPDREDLQPVRDRFGLTMFVPPVKSPEGRGRVMRIQDEFQANARQIAPATQVPKLTLDELRTIRAEVRAVEVPDVIFENLTTAQERWAQKGIEPSQRRVGQIILAIKARAWARGEGGASTDDIIVAQHMAWNHPDHIDDAREVVMEFANVFARKAARMKQNMEPILTELSNVQQAVNESGGEPDDEALQAAYKVMRDLKRVEKEAKQEADKGRAAGHDVTELESINAECTRATDWLQKTLIGGEDE